MVSVTTFGCQGFPCLLVLTNLSDPCDLEALEVHCGQRAAALGACTFHTGMLSITATNTVDTKDSAGTPVKITYTHIQVHCAFVKIVTVCVLKIKFQISSYMLRWFPRFSYHYDAVFLLEIIHTYNTYM